MVLRRAANDRSRPLDELSLEMGSLNPVFFLPGALARRGSDLASGLVEAVLLGGGQFCTKPGNVFVPTGGEGDAFLRALSSAFQKTTSPTLLSPRFAEQYRHSCKALLDLPGVSVLARGKEESLSASSARPLLVVTDPETFMHEPLLREEVFGPFSVVVQGPTEVLTELALQVEGELTATIHASQDEQLSAARLASALAAKVGRLLFDGFSPGVELCDGVNHSGPWPSALGRSTVVGTTSYERWLRPLCYQDTPANLLPPELAPDNPLNLRRRVDETHVF